MVPQWLRTPNSTNGNNVRNVNPTGNLNNNNANNSNGVAPDWVVSVGSSTLCDQTEYPRKERLSQP